MATTLTYWNGRGRCEGIRLMLAATGIEYAEAVPGFPGVTHLSEPEHFESLREAGDLLFGSVPLLVIDGMKLVQSGAIIRYLARKGGIAGRDEREQVFVDMVAETIGDLKTSIGLAFEFHLNGFEPTDAARAQAQAAAARFLPRLERVLAERAQPGKPAFFLGDTRSYADILLLEPLETLCDIGESIASYPTIARLHAELRADPKISAWLASDRRKSKEQAGIPGYVAAVKRTLRRD